MKQEISLAQLIAEKISDYSEQTNQNHLLEQTSFYAMSEKDGSVIYSFEWQGDKDADKMAQDMVSFFNKLKRLVSSLERETKEQLPPEITHFGSCKDGYFQRVLYRFRIWPMNGQYEDFERKLIKN